MNAVATERFEFAPPPTDGWPRALALAVLAHLFLIAALTWGLHWKQDSTLTTAEAELWASVPQPAAPKLAKVIPAPPTPAATPPPPKPLPVETPQVPDPDIVQQREKQERLKKEKQEAADKLAQEKRQQQQVERRAQEKRDLEAQQKKQALDKQREQDKQALERQREQDKQALDKKREQDKREQAEKLAVEKKKAEQEAKAQEAAKAREDASRQAAQVAQRADNLKRMAALAGSGAPSATGTGAKSSGPSSGYAGRVSAKVRPNIVFTDDLPANPTAEVEVRAAPDGTIVSRKLTRSSGVPAWDQAVLKALDKTETLPRDTDGSVPSPIKFSFRPKD